MESLQYTVRGRFGASGTPGTGAARRLSGQEVVCRRWAVNETVSELSWLVPSAGAAESRLDKDGTRLVRTYETIPCGRCRNQSSELGSRWSAAGQAWYRFVGVDRAAGGHCGECSQGVVGQRLLRRESKPPAVRDVPGMSRILPVVLRCLSPSPSSWLLWRE